MEHLWFLGKKLIGAAMMPVPVVLLLGAVGAVGWLRGRRWGRNLVLFSLALLLVLSLPVVSRFLIQPLERDAGPVANPAALAARGIKTVVVLSGGVHAAVGPPAEWLGNSSLRRTLEGARLWRGIPGCRLIISGGPPLSGPAAAEVMAGLARQVGVPAGAMTLDCASRDTEDQARALRAMLGSRPFALVTSAFHMRRALWWLRRHGLRPVPAPTDFQTGGPWPVAADFLPQAGGLWGAHVALHEYLGMAWAHIKGLWLPAPGGDEAAPGTKSRPER